MNVTTAGCEKKFYQSFANVVIESMAILQSLPCYRDGIDICHLVRYIERNYVVDGDVSNQVYCVIYDFLNEGQIEKYCNKYKYLGHFYRLTEHSDLCNNKKYRMNMFKNIHRGFFGRIPPLSKSKCIRTFPKSDSDKSYMGNAPSCSTSARVISPFTVFYPSSMGGTCDPCQLPKTCPAFDPSDPCSQCDDEISPVPCNNVCTTTSVSPDTAIRKCSSKCDPLNRCYENTISNPQDAIISMPTILKRPCKDTCSPLNPCSLECEPRGCYQQNRNPIRKRKPCNQRRALQCPPRRVRVSPSNSSCSSCTPPHDYRDDCDNDGDDDDDDDDDDDWATDLS